MTTTSLRSGGRGENTVEGSSSEYFGHLSWRKIEIAAGWKRSILPVCHYRENTALMAARARPHQGHRPNGRESD